jgi:predicted ribosome quality control (RQC) complex YloA/Tae2 family protein
VPNVLAELKGSEPSKDDSRVLHYQFKGFMVLVGKNAFSNERLIAEHPHRDCLHLHAMAARGSHVILCTNGKSDVSEDVIQYAAALALKNSHSQARTVSMSFLKNLEKIDDQPGLWKSKRSVSVEVLE